MHAAADWENDPAALQRCKDDVAKGDIVFANMLFMEDHIRAILPDLQARRDHCDAMIGCLSAGEVIKLTRLGSFSMNGEPGGAMALLKRLRGSSKDKKQSSGESQMAMLRGSRRSFASFLDLRRMYAPTSLHSSIGSPALKRMSSTWSAIWWTGMPTARARRCAAR